jgi:hypothetical protein
MQPESSELATDFCADCGAPSRWCTSAAQEYSCGRVRRFGYDAKTNHFYSYLSEPTKSCLKRQVAKFKAEKAGTPPLTEGDFVDMGLCENSGL